jgi:signal transduction histidine kinase/ligand-binding sensor domain-containing protein
MSRRYFLVPRTLPTLALLASAALSFAAQNKPDEDLRHETLTTWTTDQGLPQNFIRAITQTSDGFLWIGTMNGLVRFDGLHFRTPGVGVEGGVPSALHGNIGGLEPDASGGLWIATTTTLFHYAHRQFLAIPLASDAKQSYRVDAIARSHDGEMWVYGGKHLYLTSRGKLEAHPLPPGAAVVRDLAETTDGTLWLADGKAVYALKGDAAPVSFPLAGVRSLYADAFGSLYAGDGHKLYRFDGKASSSAGFVPLANPGLGNFVSVLVDSRHNLWMASGGLHGISRNTHPGPTGSASHPGSIQTLTLADGLTSDDVRILFEDRDHDIWIGTIAGLQRLHRGVFTTYSGARHGESSAHASQSRARSDPHAESEFESIFEQPNGSLWAGTLEAGVVRLGADGSDASLRRFNRADGLPNGQSRGFAMDGGAPVVALADYGIFALHGDRFSRIAGIPPGYVNTPVTTPDGSLWFAIPHSGIYRKTGSRVLRLGPAEGLPEPTPGALTLALDPDGGLWLGSGTQLYRWNQARFELVKTTPAPVYCLAFGSSGPFNNPIVGTMNGLLLSNQGHERLLTADTGLPGEAVLDVVEDAGANLWIATPRAIARVSRAQWTAFADGRAARVQAEIYTQADGLRSNTVLPLNQLTAIRTRGGRIWFATPRGLSVLDPDLDPSRMPQAAVPAVIDSVIVDDRERALTDGALTVAPGQHRITFGYTTPPTQAPEQIRFRYRLAEWDKEWIDAGNSREVSYTALPPGTYTFEVLAITRSGNSIATPTKLALHLKPFFWQTRWFIALVIVLASAIIVEITRRRTRVNAERLSLQFQERAAERERIAYQIHDTVIQDMIGTALQLELLGFQLTDQPQKAASNLDILAGRLRETIARSRNMVWSLHSTAVVQYSLVEVLRHAEAEFRLGELPRFELSSAGEPRDIHPLVRDEVYRICREALANAFRHSNAQSVHVTVRFLPDVLEVEIGDDGEGIDEDTRIHGRPGHFGLPGMQAHARRIDAQIAILSAPGKGTKILLRVMTKQPTWRWWKRRRQPEVEKEETHAATATRAQDAGS